MVASGFCFRLWFKFRVRIEPVAAREALVLATDSSPATYIGKICVFTYRGLEGARATTFHVGQIGASDRTGCPVAVIQRQRATIRGHQQIAREDRGGGARAARVDLVDGASSRAEVCAFRGFIEVACEEHRGCADTVREDFVVGAPGRAGISAVRGIIKVARQRYAGYTRAGRNRGCICDQVTPNWARGGAVRPFVQVASLEFR